ncbi:Pyridoxal-dependent decarboxylase, pyridoxal binding domain containing protein [Trichomonas vaginalis G3]|uniref:ornithine decarboxylase n=1 Tax=Trichomonas vaginalis (strain ATCC PRA-98 / G3) TaxID=412133 RepID=A2G0P3_TRIV3|nr:Type III pyridoxal 5-phosphate (PLP)-dependent enzyme ornithine decarboxylase domain-containing protein [Trichomonas vaginalis G3]EAX89268.1 Pyridoxal-dependent decarboxylase, pyridoxal binding domain containing protein [Trichomonas vaginalis G3]KAI5501950.1 Type III pyridoxal 5-phosphate (PLP)-dependent enzyme ornithine decarboxylase domain-containing protein [Trichomonas vaginalis G3]|eukprot:XP_001302198.1 Pyridoxal-dependent decarboxylase, pyridoxal binding domain containing protein [Trichomonas vaginalis G3]
MKHIAPADNYTRISALDSTIVDVQHKFDPDEGIWIADLNKVRYSTQLWESYLPRVKAHYAVKCCDEPNILRFLADRGFGFDCASKKELQMITELGVDANRIVFSHPLKNHEALVYAKELGVDRMAFDTEEELRKILRYYPEAEVFLRVKPKFTNAKIPLSKKFGAAPEDVPNLLQLAHELGANFIGFSFHVGSLCDDINTFRTALQYVSELKVKAEELGLNVCFIDIGGGFLPPNAPCNNSFKEITETINAAIDEFFGENEIEFIGEPGRFFASEYMDLILPVIGAKVHVDGHGEKTQSIYIPDGIYGAFNALIYDHAEPHFEIHTEGESEKLPTTIWGQTCDSADIVYEDMMWPELEVGDLLIIRRFSAYTYSPTAFFNGFHHHPVVVLNANEEDI